MPETERVVRRRAVEGRGDRRPPVDDDRVVVRILDVTPPDVPGIARAIRPVHHGFVDAAEEVAGARRAAQDTIARPIVWCLLA